MAIDTTLRQFCQPCGAATVTAACRRAGMPYQCCSRCCCPPGFDVPYDDDDE